MAVDRSKMDAEDRASVSAGHEQRDVSAGGLVRFVIGLVAALVVIFVITWAFFRYFQGEARSRDRRRETVLRAPRSLPPAPQLQPDPITELDELRAKENAVLGGYGWVDAKNGVVRIPIERAMQLTVQRGLQARIVSGVPAPQPPGGKLLVGSRDSTHQPKRD